jgi:hypothetical protein
MAPNDDQKPTTEERYVTATHASNLRTQADKSGSTDVLIAAAWSPSRLGAALMRLHSEFDAAEKPRRQTSAQVALLAGTLPLKNGRTDLDAARRMAHGWHLHELKMLMGKLKTLPDVREQVQLWAGANGARDAQTQTAEVLLWWLHHVCPECEGLGKERIAGTPSLSHKDCHACRGTAEMKIPDDLNYPGYQALSKRMLGHIHHCVKNAQTGIQQRLRPNRIKLSDER